MQNLESKRDSTENASNIVRFSDAINDIKVTYYSGDPTVRTWLLIENDFLPILICILYVLVVKFIGPRLMQDRQPFKLQAVLIVFNIFLVSTYTILTTIVLYLLYFVDKRMLCLPIVVSKLDDSYILARCGWITYLLKYVELLDTVFFTLRKKENQITNLHVIHHAVIPLVGWSVLRIETSGFQSIPVILNSTVHIIMYTYYALSAMGPKVRKYLWWKRYLTMIQLMQFIMVFIFEIIVVPLAGCTFTKFTQLTFGLMAVLFFLMFFNFYVQSFKVKRS